MTFPTLATNRVGALHHAVCVSVKYLWLRLQTGALTQGPEKLIVLMIEDPGLLFQESAFHGINTKAGEQ